MMAFLKILVSFCFVLDCFVFFVCAGRQVGRQVRFSFSFFIILYRYGYHKSDWAVKCYDTADKRETEDS